MAQRYEGKAKVVEVLPDSPGLVNIRFKDDATAGDGAMHDVFAGKGSLCAEISCLLFEYLNERGLDTHYVRREGPRTFFARHVGIVPIEVVVRNVTAGSICRRLGLTSSRGNRLGKTAVNRMIMRPAMHLLPETTEGDYSDPDVVREWTR